MPLPIWPAPTTRTVSNRTATSLLGLHRGAACSDLDQERISLAPARADGGEPEAPAVAAQLVNHRPEDARSRSADRMSESDGAAIHVHALRVGAEHLDRIDDDGGESLVDLDPLDVLDALPSLLERPSARLRRRAREIGEVVGDVRLRDD